VREKQANSQGKHHRGSSIAHIADDALSRHRVRMGIVNSLMAQPLGSSHLRPSELLAAAPNPSRSRRPLSAKSPERIKVVESAHLLACIHDAALIWVRLFVRNEHQLTILGAGSSVRFGS